MSSMYSPSWYRVSSLCPRLRQHTQLHRQPFGEEVTYLLQDHGTGKFYRFNLAAYDIIGRMDGERTVQAIWEASVSSLGDDAPTQDEVIEVLGRLHGADVLHGGVTPDCVELFRRAEKQRRGNWLGRLRSPLAVRIPLFDPDRYLALSSRWTGWLFSIWGFGLWLFVVAFGLLQLGPHWEALVRYGAEHALQPDNLGLMLVLYPLIKAVHELGHAAAVKRWGGEVHEVGITLLVLLPVPYVDASAATAFGKKHQRIVVSAAGMMFELFLASLALMIWTTAEPGLVRAAAFDVMLIAGISTVLFNANPLLKFDAYYILEDLIEVPSLATRSTRYLLYLLKRYLLGVVEATSPLRRTAELGWLFGYGLLSNLYRWVLTLTIVWFVAGEYFFIGVILAVWALSVQLLWPLLKGLRFLLFDPRVRSRRARALAGLAPPLALTVAALGVVPAPTITRAEGVLLPESDRQIRAGSDGFVQSIRVTPFGQVQADQPLGQLDAPFLHANVQVLEAEYQEVRTRLRDARRNDRARAKTLEEEAASKLAEVERAREKLDGLEFRSPAAGWFVPVDFDQLEGRYLRQGDTLGYVLERENLLVRVAIAQDDIGRLREGINRVSVVLPAWPDEAIEAELLSATPSATEHLPSRTLSTAGGGTIAIDPSDRDGLTASQPVFLVDLKLAEVPPQGLVGLRAHVRFEHRSEPLIHQLYRSGRQLFLSRFGV